ncbi:MAG: FAD-dependent monooxygenase, partial [Fulvimarina manganoxydans]|uniref:FAD-dependent oxidoreductase n=1 Tax=Fulvimarina manganoxydans TaxID=937218 RepID=UPI002357AE3F
MLIDLTRQKLSDDTACDICIVGAGPAGIAIALELMGSGKDVILLEAGGEKPDPDSQSFL